MVLRISLFLKDEGLKLTLQQTKPKPTHILTRKGSKNRTLLRNHLKIFREESIKDTQEREEEMY